MLPCLRCLQSELLASNPQGRERMVGKGPLCPCEFDRWRRFDRGEIDFPLAQLHDQGRQAQ